MTKKPATKRTKAPKAAIKDMSPRNAAGVKGGRVAATLNTRSVNPIAVSRDRALNS